MLYGLTGASGVGKTTIGDLIADSLDIKFVRSSITECANKHGFNAVGSMNLQQRIDLQYHLLEDHIELLNKEARPIIIDRTPIDMAGYMIAEIDMQAHSRLAPGDMARICNYVDMCLNAAQLHYDFIFHLGPLPFYEQADTRPAENAAYQLHFDLILRGLFSKANARIGHALINTTDLETRHNFIHDMIVQRLDGYEKLRRSHPRVH